MTIRHLKIFVAVCRCGSVTGAAEALYMTQPAVSLAIRELEENYGVRLFDRLTRRLRITEDGRRLLEYSQNIVGLFDEMEQAMKNPDAGGELRVGSSLTIGACLLPGYMRALEKKCPNVRTKVLVDNSESIIQAVAEGTLDLGLVEGSVRSEALTAVPFMEDTLVAVCGKTDPLASRETVTLGDFLSRPLLAREKGSGVRELQDSLLALQEKPVEPRWESASTTALLRAVEAGNGVSLLPERLAEEAVRLGHVRRLKLDVPPVSRRFYLICHRKKYLSASIRSFMEIVAGPDAV